MVNVIGLGYIGLPTALMMASHGVEVIGTDYNKELVATLNAGKTTFKEKGLDELFQNALAAGVKFTTEYQVTDTYIVSVPTPYDKFSKKVDACYVVEAVKDVMRVCPKGATVVVESTVSPGTIDKYVRPVIEANGFKIGEDINLVHAPERIIPGNMVYELLHNNRTIGADDKAMRDTTERPEGIAAGTLKLVGTEEETIYKEFSRLLSDKDEYEAMSKASNPYGDGHACERIVSILVEAR